MRKDTATAYFMGTPKPSVSNGTMIIPFFFDYLPKGTFVFEYPLVVAQKGTFSNDITTAQSMYAPEFGSHTEGIRVEVK